MRPKMPKGPVPGVPKEGTQGTNTRIVIMDENEWFSYVTQHADVNIASAIMRNQIANRFKKFEKRIKELEDSKTCINDGIIHEFRISMTRFMAGEITTIQLLISLLGLIEKIE